MGSKGNSLEGLLQTKISRRNLLKGVAKGIGVLVIPSFIIGCGDEEEIEDFSWNTGVIDSNINIGSTSIVSDSSNKSYILCDNTKNSDLIYASNSSGKWKTLVMNDKSLWVDSPSIAIHDNIFHILFRDKNRQLLFYGKEDRGGEFQLKIVNSEASVSQYSSLALDFSGNAHVSYFDEKDKCLKYATNKSRDWKNVFIPNFNRDKILGKFPSITIDRNYRVHISYYDEENDSLGYSLNNNSLWTSKTIEEGGVGLHSSIQADFQGNAVIGYYDQTHEILKLAKVGNVNNISTIDNSGNTGKFPSLVLDKDDNFHILYYSSTCGFVQYTNSSLEGEILDKNCDVQGPCSLKFNSKDNLIASWKGHNGQLMYGIKKF